MEQADFSRIVLQSGVTVIIQKKKHGTISFGIGVRCGSADSPASHFLEHLLFKGTNTRSEPDIGREATQWGGDIDAFVDFFSTFFVTKNLAMRGYDGLEILCDMVAHATLPKETMEHERQVVIEEHLDRAGSPETILMDKIYRTLYADTPLERAVVDDEKVLHKMSHAELLALYQGRYAPSQLIVVGVGPIDIDEVVEIINHYFPKKDKIAVEPLVMPKDTSPPPSARMVISGDTRRVRLMVGFPAVPRTHPDFYPLRVLSMIIGGGIASRLFEETREKAGLVYNITSHFDTVPSSQEENALKLKSDCTGLHGTLRIYSRFSPKNIERVESIVRDELKRLSNQLVSHKELDSNKKRVIGQHLISLQGTHQHVRMLFAAEINGSISDFHSFEGKIEAVTTEDVQRVARTYCDQNQGVWVILKPKPHNGRH